MMIKRGVICLVIAISAVGCDVDVLPDDLLIGFATSSYQIEGAWNEDGKGLNYFDVMTHTHPELFKFDNGDVATDSYHRYKEDVAMLKNLGAQVYRFSLSWARILPTGDSNVINQPGIDYYNNLINELLRNGIEPMVTLYHWDLPQSLVEIGGWVNSEIVGYFEKYARVAFANFGDRVKWWLTFNEPMGACVAAYTWLSEATNIPNKNGEYLCTHNVLLSHARVYRMYKNEFRPSQKGKVGITLNSFWYEPKTNSSQDREAAEIRQHFELGWYVQPLVTGHYPPVMRQRVDANSIAEGETVSRLPSFTQEESQLVRGSTDFLGINHYTTVLVSSTPPSENSKISWHTDTAVSTSYDSSWKNASSPWLKVVPWGFRKLLNWIRTRYDNPPVFITENGFSDEGELQDTGRIEYYREYIRNMLRAVHTDSCNVIGYTAWSLMDNFEWFDGYGVKFGIYHVDFSSANKTRTPKASAEFFKELSATRKLPE